MDSSVTEMLNTIADNKAAFFSVWFTCAAINLVGLLSIAEMIAEMTSKKGKTNE